jgi:hypothetical protein
MQGPSPLVCLRSVLNVSHAQWSTDGKRADLAFQIVEAGIDSEVGCRRWQLDYYGVLVAAVSNGPRALIHLVKVLVDVIDFYLLLPFDCPVLW